MSSSGGAVVSIPAGVAVDMSGLGLRGQVSNYGDLTLSNSTVYDVWTASTGALYNGQTGTLTVVNSTIANNPNSRGIYSFGGTVRVSFSTLVNNQTGGIYGGTVTIKNSLLSSPGYSDCQISELIAEGVNLSDDTSCTGFTFTNANPLLGDLRDNGGSSLTHTLLSSSPAIDAIPQAECDGALDQRGVDRPQNSACDIGAVEVIRADCNADLIIDAGDISALTLEIFDEDGADAAAASGGTFAGDSSGCDANGDNTIDAGDVSCTTLLIFEGSGSCGVGVTAEGANAESP